MRWYVCLNGLCLNDIFFEYGEYIIGKYLNPMVWVEQVGYVYIVGLPLGHEQLIYPLKNGDFPDRYVSLSEGRSLLMWVTQFHKPFPVITIFLVVYTIPKWVVYYSFSHIYIYIYASFVYIYIYIFIYLFNVTNLLKWTYQMK